MLPAAVAPRLTRPLVQCNHSGKTVQVPPIIMPTARVPVTDCSQQRQRADGQTCRGGCNEGQEQHQRQHRAGRHLGSIRRMQRGSSKSNDGVRKGENAAAGVLEWSWSVAFMARGQPQHIP